MKTEKALITILILALAGCASFAEERAAWVQESKAKCDESIGNYGLVNGEDIYDPEIHPEVMKAIEAICGPLDAQASVQQCTYDNYLAITGAYIDCFNNNYSSLLEEGSRANLLWLNMAAQLQDGLYRQANIQGQRIGALQEIGRMQQIEQQELNQQKFNRELINAVKSLQQLEPPAAGPCGGYSSC